MKEKEIKKLVSEYLKGLRSVEELEELIGKEKMAQFFVEHYLEKVKEDTMLLMAFFSGKHYLKKVKENLPEPDFNIEDIMK